MTTEQIIKNYAHDYRDISLNEYQLLGMLSNILKDIEEENES